MKRFTIVGSTMLLLLGACKNTHGGSDDKLDAANSMEHQYPRGTQEVWKAIGDAMARLDLRVESEQHDALGGRIVALRSNGDRIVVEARILDEHNTAVAVGVGAIDRNMAAMIQTNIARQLEAESSAKEFFGGSSLEANYEVSLAKGIIAGERACESLSLEVTQRDVKDTRALLLCRRPKTPSVLIRIEVAGHGQTGGAGRKESGTSPSDTQAIRVPQGNHPPDHGPIHVTFVAGTAGSPENDQVVGRVKTEFERFLK